MNFYKVIDVDTNSVIAAIDLKELIFVGADDKGNLIALKDLTSKRPCGISLNGEIYYLEGENISTQFSYKFVRLLPIGLKEYNYLKEILKDTYFASINEDSYENISIAKDESTLNTSKLKKLNSISKECKKAITDGVDVTLSDKKIYHFDLTTEDQLNINRLRYCLLTDVEDIAYHSKGNLFEYYSREDIQILIDAIDSHILYHNSYFNSLKNYVNSLESIEEVDSIYYGQDFPQYYKSEILLSLEQEISKNY